MPLMFDGAECAVCGAGPVQHHTFMYSPSILAMSMPHTTTPPDMSFELPVREGTARYSFAGMLYNHGDAHFTARYLMHPGSFGSMMHGMVTGRAVRMEGTNDQVDLTVDPTDIESRDVFIYKCEPTT